MGPRRGQCYECLVEIHPVVQHLGPRGFQGTSTGIESGIPDEVPTHIYVVEMGESVDRMRNLTFYQVTLFVRI